MQVRVLPEAPNNVRVAERPNATVCKTVKSSVRIRLLTPIQPCSSEEEHRLDKARVDISKLSMATNNVSLVFNGSTTVSKTASGSSNLSGYANLRMLTANFNIRLVI